MSKHDALSTRLKGYEEVTRYKLYPRTFTVLRLDGVSFSNFTKYLEKPFDDGLIEDMNLTAIHLAENIMGCKAVFTQSDEINIIVTDFDNLTTESWYGGIIQKIASISASIASAKFNQLRTLRNLQPNDEDRNFIFDDDLLKLKLAYFDCRVFQIPFVEEAINIFQWRQQDATRNSISSVAQSLYSHKQLEGKNSSELQEMIFAKGINWNDLDEGKKRGRLIVKVQKEITTDKGTAIRNKWEVVETPIFSTPEGKELLRNIILPK